MKFPRAVVLAFALMGVSVGCTVVQPRYTPVEERVVETTTYDVPAQPAYEPPPVEVAPVYQNDLAPYGRWIVYSHYGRCWMPNSVGYGWQPYTVGHWVYTDDGCCTWVSEATEVAWGGIVYHYGQWTRTNDIGWIWVPGTTWAPAWVAWREGGGYCGWAPLPPEAVYQNRVTYIEADRYCPPDRYVYVDEHNFDGGRVDRHFVHNNTTVINNTRNITNITVVNNTVINNGVPSRDVERISGRRVQRVAVVHASDADQARRMSANGTPVHYDSPTIERVHNQTIQQVPSQKRILDAQQKQAAHQQEVEAAKDRAGEHAKEVAEHRQSAQAEHQRQIEAQQQAARQHQLEQQQKADDARQAAQERAAQKAKEVQAAKEAQKEKRAQGKPKPGQPHDPSDTPPQ